MKLTQNNQSFELSRYVFFDENSNLYHNSVNDKSLPKDANYDQFRENNFLVGQEKQSIEDRLFSDPKKIQFVISPTWECTLRCSHCSVLHLLKKKDKCNIKVDNLINFMHSVTEIYEEDLKISGCFVGGEALIESKFCHESIKALRENFKGRIGVIGTTTNLAYDLNKDIYEFFKLCDYIGISLDGTEDQHNWQRKSLNKENPFQSTVNNIKRLILLGLKDKISIKASIQDEVYSEEKREEFYRFIYSLGIKDIEYGCVHSTVRNPNVDDRFLKHISSPSINHRPCCDFRHMKSFLLNSDGSITKSYYHLESDYSQLSHLDNFEEINHDHVKNDIEPKYRENIIKSMPALNDSKCLNECPVIGYCWGKCSNTQFLTKDKPSDFCDQKGTIEMVKKGYAKK